MFAKCFLDKNEIYFTLMLLIDHAGNGPASKKKLKSQKNKKRKRCEEVVEAEEEFPSARNACSDTEDIRTDQVGTEHQLKQLKTEPTARQHGNKLGNNTTHM